MNKKLVEDIHDVLKGQHVRGWEEKQINGIKGELFTMPAGSGVEAIEKMLFGSHGRLGIIVFLNLLLEAFSGEHMLPGHLPEDMVKGFAIPIARASDGVTVAYAMTDEVAATIAKALNGRDDLTSMKGTQPTLEQVQIAEIRTFGQKLVDLAVAGSTNGTLLVTTELVLELFGHPAKDRVYGGEPKAATLAQVPVTELEEFVATILSREGSAEQSPFDVMMIAMQVMATEKAALDPNTPLTPGTVPGGTDTNLGATSDDPNKPANEDGYVGPELRIDGVPVPVGGVPVEAGADQKTESEF